MEITALKIHSYNSNNCIMYFQKEHYRQASSEAKNATKRFCMFWETYRNKKVISVIQSCIVK